MSLQVCLYILKVIEPLDTWLPTLVYFQFPESIFLQRRCLNVQQAHEKMLGIANPQRNINQNHYEVLPHLCQNGYHQNVWK